MSTPVIVETNGKTEERWSVARRTNAVTLETRHGNTVAPNLVARMLRTLESTFLPEGYPASVSPDYLRYQVFDTLQALCSSMTGTLSTRAVLKGVGVGDATATAMSGTVSWLLRDGAGMIGRILFATVVASDLDHDAKRWRLAADVTNDIGLVLNILSEHVAPAYFLPMLCLASLFFAVTSTAGGATRASLTQHFAKRHNTADVSAKDGSQETAVGLIGMCLGMAVAVLVPPTFWWTLATLLSLTGLHLLANYLGVKSLVLEHLNENRLVLCLARFAEADAVPTPAEMTALEGVILPGPRIVPVTLGVSLRALHDDDQDRSSSAGAAADATRGPGDRAATLIREAQRDLEANRYFAAPMPGSGGRAAPAFGVVLAHEATHMDVLAAYCECVTRSGRLQRPARRGPFELARFVAALEAAGWRTDRFQLRVRDWRVRIGGRPKDS